MKTQNTLSSLATRFFGGASQKSEPAEIGAEKPAAEATATVSETPQTLSQAPVAQADGRPSIPGVEILGVEGWTQWRAHIRQKGRERTVSARDLALLNLLRGLPAERGFAPLSPRNWTDGRMAWQGLAIALDGLDMNLAELARVAAGTRPARPWLIETAKSLFGEKGFEALQGDAQALASLAALSSEARRRIRATQSDWQGKKERGEELPPEARVSEAPIRAPKAKPETRSPAQGGAHGL